MENATPVADANVDNLLEGVDEDGHWDFEGAMAGKFAQLSGMKRKLLDLQDECRTKKRRVLANLAEVVELAQELLQSTDVLVNAVASLEVPVTTGGITFELATKLNKHKAFIAEVESVETITIPRRGDVSDEDKQRHTDEISVWKETSAENADSVINNGKVAKADSIKMSVNRNLILDRFEEHVRALQALIDANVLFHVRTKGDVNGRHEKGERATREWSID